MKSYCETYMDSNARQKRDLGRWPWIAALGLVFVSGCGSSTNQVLPAEAAKEALLEMDQLQIPGAVHARLPKEEDPIESINVDRISIGAWRCDLKEKTFYAVFHFPGAIRHEMTEVQGVFQPAPNGKWIAKVTSAHD